jgi:hypothetical protein
MGQWLLPCLVAHQHSSNPILVSTTITNNGTFQLMDKT